MATFALVHGSGDGGWAWHLVQAALRERGHEAVAPDLPTDRDDATWEDCAATVVDAVAGAEGVVVVGHSSGGFVAPLAAARLRARLQVYVTGMVPAPGETPTAWFDNLGWSDDAAGLDLSDPTATFYRDVAADLAREAMARERPTSERLARAAWPSSAAPAIPARYVVTTRDRFLPPPVQRRAAARLSITAPDAIDAGHCPHLARPEELAGMLVRFAHDLTP